MNGHGALEGRGPALLPSSRLRPASRLRRALCIWPVGLALFGAVPSVASEYSLDFSKNLNVWSWDHRLGWRRPVGESLLVTTKADHELKLSDTPGFTRRSTGTKGDLQLAYTFTPKLTVGLGLTMDQSRLQTGAARSDVESYRAASSLTYRPFAGLELSPSLGRAYDKRRNVADAGIAYGLGVALRPFEETLRRHGLGLSMDYSRSGVSSRQGDVASRLAVGATYAWGGAIAQGVRYAEAQDEQKYVSAGLGNPILRRITENRSVQSNLSAAFPWVGQVELQAGYTTGRVDDDASKDRNDLKYRTNNRTHGWTSTTMWTLPFAMPTIRYLVSLGRTQREAEPVVSVIPGRQDSLVARPNDLDRRTSDLSMSLSSFVELGARDSALVSGTLALSRDHTPATTEVNDRDDYRRSLVAAYWHTFDHGTSVELRAERTETHQVWLMRERSANNKWDRVLNLWATTRIEVGDATITQRGFFRTALEEFDFDYLTPDQPRSRNSRIARLDFNGTLAVGDAGNVSLEYSVEARTLGNLLPAGAGKRPTVWQLTRNEFAQVISLSLATAPGRSWQLGPSISLNRRREYIPTRTHWNPLHLGNLADEQEGMQVETFVSYTPRSGLFKGSDSITAKMNRTYRRRAGFHDTTSYISVTYQHVF